MHLFRKQRELNEPAATWVSLDDDPEILDLLRTLDDQDPDRRWHAILKMWRHAMAVVPLLVALEDVSARVRTVAATGLGLAGDERAVEPLLAVLQDQADDSDVRTSAAWALGKLQDERTFEVLLAALQDTHENVRGAAVYALSQFADERVFALLLAALQDSSSHVRRAAAFGLGDLVHSHQR